MMRSNSFSGSFMDSDVVESQGSSSLASACTVVSWRFEWQGTSARRT